MNPWPKDVDWGSWVLGDLADVLVKVSQLAGRSAAIEHVLLAPPTGPEELPRVGLALSSMRDISRMRDELAEGEYPVRFLDGASAFGWRADVAGVTIEAGFGGGAE